MFLWSRAFTVAAMLALLPHSVWADGPTIKILLGYPPGASGDATTRLIGDKIQTTTGQAVVVENHPGAEGRIVMDMLKRATPDGTTLVMTPQSPIVTAPFVYKVRYDPFKDFAPLAQVARVAYTFVINPSVPANTLAEFLNLVKKDPAKYGYYSSPASGSIAHMSIVSLAKSASVTMNNVNYRGASEALVDLLGSRISSFVSNEADVVEMVKADKLKALATFGEERSKRLPSVPTMKELGYNLITYGWFGFYTTAGTPQATVDRLSKVIVDAVHSPDVIAKLDSFGLDATGLDSATLLKIEKADADRWGAVIKDSGFKPQN